MRTFIDFSRKKGGDGNTRVSQLVALCRKPEIPPPNRKYSWRTQKYGRRAGEAPAESKKKTNLQKKPQKEEGQSVACPYGS